MITFTLMLITADRSPERVTVELNMVPNLHEMIQLGGRLYRVEDVTHDVQTKEIEVRAIA